MVKLGYSRNLCGVECKLDTLQACIQLNKYSKSLASAETIECRTTSIGSCFLATRYRAFPDCVKMHNAACASSWSQKKLLNLLIVTTHVDVQWESLNCLAISAALSCSGLAEKQIRIPAFYLVTTTLGSIILTYLDQHLNTRMSSCETGRLELMAIWLTLLTSWYRLPVDGSISTDLSSMSPSARISSYKMSSKFKIQFPRSP